ncbi:MAG: PilZ domain-containing protein [Acidobacteriota bacterium]
MNQASRSPSGSTLVGESLVRFKVLVVDAPGPHRDRLIDVLGEIGYNVDHAADSESTYRKLKTSVRPVDLLIVDLQSLHEVDGLRFLQLLKREEYCQSTQLIITTEGLLDDRLAEVRGGLAIRGCFHKLRPLEELVSLITAVLPPLGQNLRASLRFPVQFVVEYGVGAHRELYRASNLSLGGIFLETPQPDPVGTLAELRFVLPGGKERIQATAKVVRTVRYESEVATLRHQTFPPGVGLAFVTLSPEDRRLLTEFCQCEEARIFGWPARPAALQEDP